MISKQEITQAVASFVGRAEKVAAALSPADWQKPVYEQGWSVKQVYCHLAAMGGSVAFLVGMASSPPPTGAAGGGFDVDAWNAQQVAARQDKPIEDILAELKTGFENGIRILQGTSEELLAKHLTMPWGASGTLAELLMASVASHDQEHLDDVERAVRRA